MSSPLTDAKAGLRKQVRARLKDLPEVARAEVSATLCARLQEQEFWQEARAVLFFAPLPDEPNVWPLLEAALLAGKTVALPRFASQMQTYLACVVQNPQTDLQSGQFAIREPGVSCPEIALNRLDLALVPGVAFDLRGGRLGRGRGFYDRLLAAVRGTKCGVAFDEQIVSEIPVGPLDIRLNCILTPTRWIET